MKSFQSTCSKNNQKITLVITAEDEEEARHKLHAQGYSIIELEEFKPDKNSIAGASNFFYFDAVIGWERKSWQIQSNDIFKAYKKLIEDLWYDILYIYTTKNATDEQKKLLTMQVKDSYELYSKQQWDSEINQSLLKKHEQKSDAPDIDAGLERELVKYLSLIDIVIQKIDTITTKHSEHIVSDKRERLNQVRTSLLQIKGTTNLSKLKIVAETALKKIGELEVELIEKNVLEEKATYINETNRLLKQFWSGDKIAMPGQTDSYKKIEWIVSDVVNSFFSKEEEIKIEDKKKDPNAIDTNSFVFYKNLRELNLYKIKLKEVNREIIFARVQFQTEKTNRLILKRRLIEQNIRLLENRIKHIRFSYTKLMKGFNYYVEAFFELVSFLSDAILYSIFVFSAIFIVVITLIQFEITSIPFNFNVIFFITLISGLAFVSRFMKWYISLAFGMFFYTIMGYFILINF